MIVVSNVSKMFTQAEERVQALSHVSLHVAQGECVLLKGASGSGKSTLLSLIAGLAQPTSGSIVVDGEEISKMPERLSAKMRRERIGFIFQKFHLIPYLSVQENVTTPLVPENIPLHVIEAKAKRAMERCRIAHKAHMYVHRLSGGEQQRTAIARALVRNPMIVLADEPTANLDRKLSLSLIEELRALKHEGVTLVIATHDPLFFDLDFVDQTIELHHGVLRP
ncbi:ABC transporter ATP-binding protein [Sulfurospirillum cavolei]|uniref:ABC transporter ATP-binding protein n=1 Tax=Sulfurospirillum cavolei TaxID=366522 RepID=UPI0005AB5ECF|nr:ABC transporter ATP-binding protein [Sulfurospirillum cavolei]